jgi:hypothetical protein
MHHTSSVNWTAFLLAGLSLAVASCGGMIEGDARGSDPGAANTVSATTDALRARHRAPAATTSTATAATSAPAATGATPAAVAASVTADQAIAAAQTVDGRAIPQGSGPGGTCPAVLTILGFWSCPTIGDTCVYASADGAGHACSCNRTDGEGQAPSWVCQ